MKKFLVVLYALLFAAFAVSADDPLWMTVMAGKNTSNPVAWNKHLYFVGEDKGLNCIDINGSFVWRRNTAGIGNFLSVSASGMVCVGTTNGKLQAFSSQGIPIWSFDLKEMPVYAPYNSLDGRLFILTEQTLFCFSQQGVLKWKRKLPAAPALPLAETGNGEILLVLKNGDFLRLSIFGHLNEEKKLIKTVSALSKAPSGYLMACTDGSLFYYKTAAGSQSQWQVTTSSPAVALLYSNGHYAALCADGAVWLSTIANNEKVWYAQLNKNITSGASISLSNDELYLCDYGFAACILIDGTVKWQQSIPEAKAKAVITENGLLIGVDGKIINAYRMEVKFLRDSPHAKIPEDSYDIIGNGMINIPPVFDSAGSQKFFAEVTAGLKDGTVSEREPEYAACLVGIVQNKWQHKPFATEFSTVEQAEAARLLGRLGSYEYREYLIDAGYATDDPTVTAGIVDGLGYIGYDPDDKTMDYVKKVISRTAHNNTEVMRSVCDCLEALAKFGDNTTVTASISTLFSIINGKFSNNIAAYAKQRIENILQ